MLSACGDGSHSDKSVALRACAGTGATRGQCECAIAKAQAAGISPARMAAEENAGTAILDGTFVNAAAGCLAVP